MITFKAHANIALLKYWGKQDAKLVIPTTSSVSMTLEALSTTTSVQAHPHKDVFILDGQLQGTKETEKLSAFIDLFRERAHSSVFVEVNSHNNFPTAAGLASSASGYAALAGALNIFFNLNYDATELSKLARKGSGSASRSLHGGFVVWEQGVDDDTSKAYQIDKGQWDVKMIIVLCNRDTKKISSRQLMEETKNESIFYDAWVQQSHRIKESMISAIINHDFTTMGQLATQNAWQMHATMLGLKQPFTYFEARSFEALKIVDDLRSSGVEVYETMDAGPNVKILVQEKNIDITLKALKTKFSNDELIVSAVI